MQNISVTRVAGEPIILAKVKGYITAETLIEVYRQSDELRKDMPKNIYRITNVTEVKSSFADMMQIIKQASTRGGSSSVDPTIKVVFVGTSHWVKLFTDALRQGAFGGKEIPVFSKEGDALAYVMTDIANKNKAAG